MRTKMVWVVRAILPCLAIPISAGPSLAADVSGTFKVKATLPVSPSLPNGTQITAFASATFSDTVFTGNVSIQGVATVSGGQVTFKLLMPYAWKVESAADTVIVQLTVQGSASGAAAEYTDSSLFSQTIALPANGATTPVIFTGSL
jgi:hypothetical protein